MPMTVCMTEHVFDSLKHVLSCGHILVTTEPQYCTTACASDPASKAFLSRGPANLECTVRGCKKARKDTLGGLVDDLKKLSLREMNTTTIPSGGAGNGFAFAKRSAEPFTFVGTTTLEPELYKTLGTIAASTSLKQMSGRKRGRDNAMSEDIPEPAAKRRHGISKPRAAKRRKPHVARGRGGRRTRRRGDKAKNNGGDVVMSGSPIR